MPASQVVAAKRMARRRTEAARAAHIEPGAYKAYETTIYLGGISMPSLLDFVRRGLLRPNRHFGQLIFSKVECDRFLSEVRPRNGARK